MLNIDFLNNDYADNRTPAEKAREQIKISILNHELKPGQRLIENKLCDQYSLSRPPLREIINQLAAEGFVDLIPNRGAFVSEIDSRMLDDILYMKNLLYPQAVRWAVERITVDEMDVLQEVYGFIEFYAPTGDIPKLERFARGFDAVIYDAAKNHEIERSLLKYDFIIEHTQRMIRYPVNYPEIIWKEYKAIFDAFRTRNVSQGEEAAQQHAFRSMLRIRSGA
ncbi:MAG: GntR family transcriptional regulator [Firmicutes bacterium]|nr:GntR family transcriptional regulator [Bacillota bacterium]MBR3261315.1 GntR family transcriptional regulator [Bacillota bacterium]MBR3375120.1 GntR family transcriptional regulator [Bacillota bacterium]